MKLASGNPGAVHLGIFIDHRGFHAIVKHLGRGTAHRIEGVDVTAHHRLQILGRTEPTPQPAAVAQHHREQPEDPGHTRLIAERHLELGEVDLGLPSRVSKRRSNWTNRGGRHWRRKSVTVV